MVLFVIVFDFGRLTCGELAGRFIAFLLFWAQYHSAGKIWSHSFLVLKSTELNIPFLVIGKTFCYWSILEIHSLYMRMNYDNHIDWYLGAHQEPIIISLARSRFLCGSSTLQLCYQSGLRSRSRGRSWSRSESTVLAGVGVRAGVGKIWPTPTSARSRRLTPGDRI